MPGADVICCRECGQGYNRWSEPPCGHSQALPADSPLAQLEADRRTREGERSLQERIPSAWSEWGDGHDYSRTGKHDPQNCRQCLRLIVAKVEASALADRVVKAEARVSALVSLAKRAVNGWACYAKRDIEHREIAALHAAIKAEARQERSTPETAQRLCPGVEGDDSRGDRACAGVRNKWESDMDIKPGEFHISKVGEFHISDGFTLRRVEGFGNASDGQPITHELRLYSAGGHVEGGLLARALLTESMLASVMASASRRGESSNTHLQALQFLQEPKGTAQPNTEDSTMTACGLTRRELHSAVAALDQQATHRHAYGWHTGKCRCGDARPPCCPRCRRMEPCRAAAPGGAEPSGGTQ